MLLTSDAAASGTNSNGVWVQDGDTVTVSYLDSSGTTIDTDTMTVDGVKPAISGIVPADGIVTNVTNPTVQFDVTDAGSGITSTNPGQDIRIEVNGTLLGTGTPSFQAIANGYRVIFASGTSWLQSVANGGFGVIDGTKFTWKITAKDKAGNEKVLGGVSLELTIDTTAATPTPTPTPTPTAPPAVGAPAPTPPSPTSVPPVAPPTSTPTPTPGGPTPTATPTPAPVTPTPTTAPIPTATPVGVNPTVSNIQPANGTVTNVQIPTIFFEVTDTGPGLNTVNPGQDITIEIHRQRLAGRLRLGHLLASVGRQWRLRRSRRHPVPVEDHGEEQGR